MNTTQRCPQCNGTGFVLVERMVGDTIIKMPTPCLSCETGRRMLEIQMTAQQGVFHK